RFAPQIMQVLALKGELKSPLGKHGLPELRNAKALRQSVKTCALPDGIYPLVPFGRWPHSLRKREGDVRKPDEERAGAGFDAHEIGVHVLAREVVVIVLPCRPVGLRIITFGHELAFALIALGKAVGK